MDEDEDDLQNSNSVAYKDPRRTDTGNANSRFMRQPNFPRTAGGRGVPIPPRPSIGYSTKGQAKVGTARRDGPGNLQPGEYDGYNQPMSTGGDARALTREHLVDDDFSRSFPNAPQSSVNPDGSAYRPPVFTPGSPTSRPVNVPPAAQPNTAAAMQTGSTVATGIVANAPEQQGVATPPRFQRQVADQGQVTSASPVTDYKGATTYADGQQEYDARKDLIAPSVIAPGRIALPSGYNPPRTPAGSTNVGSVRFLPKSAPSQIVDETGDVTKDYQTGGKYSSAPVPQQPTTPAVDSQMQGGGFASRTSIDSTGATVNGGAIPIFQTPNFKPGGSQSSPTSVAKTQPSAPAPVNVFNGVSTSQPNAPGVLPKTSDEVASSLPGTAYSGSRFQQGSAAADQAISNAGASVIGGVAKFMGNLPGDYNGKQTMQRVGADGGQLSDWSGPKNNLTPDQRTARNVTFQRPDSVATSAAQPEVNPDDEEEKFKQSLASY